MKKDKSNKKIINDKSEDIVDDIIFEAETDSDMVGVKSAFGIGGEDSQIRKLKKKLREAQEKAKENLDGWQRLKADVANAKQGESERFARAKERGVENVLDSLLPALDSFDSAMQGDAWDNIDEAWRMGMEFVYGQLIGALEANGVSRYGAIGDMLDNNMHEVADGSDVNGVKIKKVLRSGYRAGDKIIRPAKIMV
jgi:molecular chaperone GrpE